MIGIGDYIKATCRYVCDCRSRGREFAPGIVQDFVEIDNETISTAILLPSADSRMAVVKAKLGARSTG